MAPSHQPKYPSRSSELLRALRLVMHLRDVNAEELALRMDRSVSEAKGLLAELYSQGKIKSKGGGRFVLDAAQADALFGTGAAEIPEVKATPRKPGPGRVYGIPKEVVDPEMQALEEMAASRKGSPPSSRTVKTREESLADLFPKGKVPPPVTVGEQLGFGIEAPGRDAKEMSSGGRQWKREGNVWVRQDPSLSDRLERFKGKVKKVSPKDLERLRQAKEALKQKGLEGKALRRAVRREVAAMRLGTKAAPGIAGAASGPEFGLMQAGRFLAKNKIGALAAIPLLPLATRGVIGFVESIGESIGAKTTDEIVELQRQQKLQRLMAQRQRRAMTSQIQAEELRQRNEEYLASTNPHLYQELQAGRRLPEDAVVIGRAPGQDLLDSILEGMNPAGGEM